MLTSKIRKAMIFLLTFTALILLAISHCLYNNYSEIAPSLLHHISLFFSNYIVLVASILFPLLIQFFRNKFRTLKIWKHRGVLGVCIAFAPFVIELIIFTHVVNNDIPTVSADATWSQNIFFPTAVSIMSSLGLSLFFDKYNDESN